MSKFLACTAAAMSAGLASCTSPPDWPAEALVAMPIYQPPRFYVAPQQPIPPDVVEDLHRFAETLRGLDIPRATFTFEFSPDGRAALACDSIFLDEGRGTWIWPSWRHPDRFHRLKEFSFAKFLGPEHVLCTNPPVIMDIVSGRQWALPEQVNRFHGASVDDSGTWWAIATPDSRVLVGRLDHDRDRLEPSRVFDLPDELSDEYVDFVGERHFLVVSLKGGATLALDVETGDVAEILRIVPSRHRPRGRPGRAGPGGIVVDRAFVRFGPDIRTRTRTYLGLGPSEFVYHGGSPSGGYVFTLREVMFTVKHRVRRTPLANDELRAPLLPPAGIFDVRGWITWDAETTEQGVGD
jgi:hypothetical protein